ncbi:hypothetical protein vseg_016527 [Gypsophila vaccaria]
MAALQAEKAATTSDELLRQPQVRAQLTVRNVTPAAMRLDRSISWFGTPTAPFPPTIAANGSVNIVHERGAAFTSKGAVVYAGTNASNQACAWVLAWDAPHETNLAPNKVYVACGLKSAIDGINFDRILESLDASSAESNVSNQTSKTRAFASIMHLIPNSAFVGADFNRML